MSSTNLTDVTSGYNLLKINANFQEIERVLNEEVLHRVNDGSLPNTLETAIDANSQPIYNLRKPETGGEPLRLKDLFGDPSELLSGPEVENFTAVGGETVFTLSSSYVPGSSSLHVFRNGIFLTEDEYVETSTNTITLAEPAVTGDIISVVPVAVSGTSASGSAVTGSNVGTGTGVYKGKVGETLSFKTLVAGSNVTISGSENEVTISASSSGSTDTTASNLGTTGEGVYASKVGSDLRFKKLKAGINVTLSSDSESITINSSGSGGSIAVYEGGVLKTSGASSFNFVNSTVGVAGAAVTITDAAKDFVNVKDYGAVGDGTTNDSSAIQTAITAAQSANKSVFFPDGSYVISSLGTQAGRLILIGTGNSTLKGTLTYYEPSPPVAANTSTALTPTSDFFGASGINFQSTSTDYALKLSTVQQTEFLSTFALSHCKFFGNKGLLAQHMIGFEVTNCEFNNTVCGARVEGCVNGLWTACRFQNQAESGIFITGHATESNRRGGENMRFVNCEWAVCTYGIIANEHMWLTLEGCLLDYCDTPLYLSGSQWAKAVNTYFGASNVASTRFSGVSGYLAPGPKGTAIYGRPSGTPVGSKTFGFTAHNCEFIAYDIAATQPIVYLDGYVNSTYQMSADEIGFYDCLFYATGAHTLSTLLEISHVAIARVIGCRFRSYNLSSTMSNAYRTVDCFDWINHSNSFWNCTQSGAQVRSAYELGTGTIISATAPTSPYPGMIWVTP